MRSLQTLLKIYYEYLTFGEVDHDLLDQSEDHPLLCAAQDGDVNEVLRLLALGSPVEVVAPRTGFTPLFLAADNSHPEVVMVLLYFQACALGDFSFNDVK